MMRNGEPYIPSYPLCPTERDYGGCHITPNNFHLDVDEVRGDDTIEVFGVWYTKDLDDYRNVATGTWKVPVCMPWRRSGAATVVGEMP
jgi:hypothetical protein